LQNEKNRSADRLRPKGRAVKRMKNLGEQDREVF